MVGNGTRRGDGAAPAAISSRNVFAALETLKKKKKSGKAKEEPAPLPQVFWAPTPLNVKSWADVDDDDDDDYYQTTAPPSAWGAPEPKKSKEVTVVLEEESESEDEGLDEAEDDAFGEESEHQLEVSDRADPDLKKPALAYLVPKDAERQLSKKELKKKELAELEAVLAELGISAEENDTARQDENKGVAEEKKQGEHCGTDEKKDNDAAPAESKTSKKKKAKKEKSSKEAKDSGEQVNGSVPKGSDTGGVGNGAGPPLPETSAVDMKERLKRMASTKRKSSKEMDSAARAAAVEAAARSAKLAAAKKKEKNHYNQQPVR